MITHFTTLKSHSIFSKLNKIQSIYDAADPVITESGFTRSPRHAIVFLIAYAGLSGEQKQQVVSTLNDNEITVKALDALIDDINWTELLKQTDKTLSLGLVIELAHPEALYDALQRQCPTLHSALKSSKN